MISYHQGSAWFDEPTASDTAHGLAVCSNMGTCDRSTGLCTCRLGFIGPACEIKDCDRDKITRKIYVMLILH